MSDAAPLAGKVSLDEKLSLRPAARTLVVAGARRTVLAAFGIALVVGVWWLISLNTTPVRVPSPSDVVSTLSNDWSNIPALSYIAFQSGGIGQAVGFTTIHVIEGVAVGSGAGFVLGAVLGRVRLARELLEAPMLALATIPILTLLPFLVIWFGTASIAQSGLVVMFALVTVAAVVQQAALDVGRRYTEYAASLGAGDARVLREVVLPAVVPAAIGGVRVATAAGWSFETVSELLGGQHGAGKLISAMESISATNVIVATVIAIGTVAVLLDCAIALVGGLLVQWQE
jgi:ABC-type nitrate/sulfonate/bicarbonate transport system permease component